MRTPSLVIINKCIPAPSGFSRCAAGPADPLIWLQWRPLVAEALKRALPQTIRFVNVAVGAYDDELLAARRSLIDAGVPNKMPCAHPPKELFAK
jgi:hypothetical protein